MYSTTRPVVSGAGRGDLSIQPSYFTSSLFVNTLREDIANLVEEFDKQLKLRPDGRPFLVFKKIWVEQGWSWLHLKVLEPRAREMFLNVVLRLFLEQTRSSEPPVNRVIGVMSIYTFYATQPSMSVPAIHSEEKLSIAADQYRDLVCLPRDLERCMPACKETVSYLLGWLAERNAFSIIPASHLQAENPRSLPREIVNSETHVNGSDVESITDGTKRKTGRPSKAEKQQRAKNALVQLDKWIEKSSYPENTGSRADSWQEADRSDGTDGNERTTHILLSQRPTVSLDNYRQRKAEMLVRISESHAEDDPVDRASRRVLTRLHEIDALAAERGLEIGTEGGDKSGLGRVEKAMEEVEDRERRRGLLGLVDGAGLDN